jgi:hypothetical protein
LTLLLVRVLTYYYKRRNNAACLYRNYNFKSIKDIKLDLTKFKDKTVLIQATNEDDAGALSNRGGKSNLMKALVWGLFGVSFIEGTSDEITTYGEKETFVIVRFDTGAEIERRFKNKAQTFFYRKNGKMNQTVTGR